MILATKYGEFNIYLHNVREVSFKTFRKVNFYKNLNSIVGVQIGDKKVVIGDKVKIGEVVMTVNYIDRIDDSSFAISEIKTNITTTFILPIVFTPRFLTTYSLYRVNSYVFKDGLYNKELYILFYNQNDIDLKLQIPEYIKNTPCKIEEIGKYLLVTVKLPANFLTDIHYIINSKYSYVSKLAKDKLISYYQFLINNPEDIYKSLIYKILTRDNEYRLKLQQNLGVNIPSYLDLYEGFSMDKENLNYQNLVENESVASKRASLEPCITFV